MIRCLIVDDEQYARKLLESYVARISGFEVSHVCRNTYEAEIYLSRNVVDLIFMDIEMPGRKGTQFVAQQRGTSQVIFTTAFSQYALDGFELDAVDYLLKPIGFQRFRRAMHKAARLFLEHESIRDEGQHIWVKEGYEYKKVALDELIFVESMREYVCYYTKNERVLELKSLGKVNEALPEKDFIRIHRSFLVAKKAVVKFGINQVELVNGRVLPIGKTYRKKFGVGVFL